MRFPTHKENLWDLWNLCEARSQISPQVSVRFSTHKENLWDLCEARSQISPQASVRFPTHKENLWDLLDLCEARYQEAGGDKE